MALLGASREIYWFNDGHEQILHIYGSLQVTRLLHVNKPFSLQ